MVNLVNQIIKLETIVIEQVSIEERHIHDVILINIYLPIVFHNLKGYDSHIILKEAFEICGTDKNITAIPNSMEKFMTFGVGDIKFIDSFQFMASSLETLAENLITDSTDNYEMFENMET